MRRDDATTQRTQRHGDDQVCDQAAKCKLLPEIVLEITIFGRCGTEAAVLIVARERSNPQAIISIFGFIVEDATFIG
jgi:hypothetical protein